MVTPQFVVTGFGRFPGVDTNPTQELVERLLQDFAANAASGELDAGWPRKKVGKTLQLECCASEQFSVPYRWLKLCLRDPGSVCQNSRSVAASRGFSSAQPKRKGCCGLGANLSVSATEMLSSYVYPKK